MEIMQNLWEFYEGYKNFQRVHPHLATILTAEIVYLTGDLMSQLISDGRVDKRKLGYTAALAPIYGACLEGIIETGEIVGRHISDNALAKAALGPNLIGNLFNTFFFVNNTIGERKKYSVPALVRHYANLFSSDESENRGKWENFKKNYIHNIPGKEYLFSFIATISLWNGFQTYNYVCVDPEMRTSTTLGATLIWTTVLSLWSLKGRRKVIERDLENGQ